MSIIHCFRAAAIAGLIRAASCCDELPSATASTAADPAVLAKQVQIRRTQFGVPHIEGETLEAAAFGFAYCQAEDHLENILRGILGVRGQLAATLRSGRKRQEHHG